MKKNLKVCQFTFNNKSKAYCSTSTIGVFITNKLFVGLTNECASAFDFVGLDGTTISLFCKHVNILTLR